MITRTLLKSKIHRATVTDADLHYVGSITIDEDLLKASDILKLGGCRSLSGRGIGVACLEETSGL